jgi:tRNA G18 (ribose-2'-O)-methylase SpoU
MLTRCPSPKCRHEFDLPCSTDRANSACPACGQTATFRSLELAVHVDKVYGHKLASGDTIESLAAAEVEQATLSVLVEDVRSLWNVGSIFRTADGSGFSQLFLSGITGCPPRKEIAKTSLGAEESVAWSYCRNALEVLPALRTAGVMIVGLECSAGSISLTAALAENRLTAPLCLVVGNEVNGLSAESISLCDLICHLPMRGKKESLNVAVAFGIAAYTIAEHLLSRNDRSS